jgi:hypothetical protein
MNVAGLECDSQGMGNSSCVNMRELVTFGPSFIFRRVVIPAERLINIALPARPSVHT